MRFCFLIIAFIVFACNDSGNQVTVRLNKKDTTDKLAVYSSENDKMNMAIDAARISFATFLKEVKNPCENCGRYNVKMRFAFGDGNGEHIWLDNLFFVKNDLFGIVASEPENVLSIKIGDSVKIDKASLSDWMFVKDGRLVGGHTIKTIYRNSSEAEKREMENEFGAKIE